MAARAPRKLPRQPPTLTPVHPLLPRRRTEGNSNDGKVCRVCRGGTPGEGPAEGASGARYLAWTLQMLIKKQEP